MNDALRLVLEQLERASLILLTQAKRLSIRARVDGLMTSVTELEGALLDGLKAESGVDVQERRLPQMGLIWIGRAQFEVHTNPIAEDGERVALVRLGEEPYRVLPLAELGLRASDLEILEGVLAERRGLVLCTGPTRSGMNMTCYSALSALDSERLYIGTVEVAPREALWGVQQSRLAPKLGLGFVELICAFMQSDVDVLYVRELMDRETTELSLNMAVAGALVFSTIHTPGAPGALIRLGDMGVAPWLCAEGLRLVLGQRLLRRLCGRCKQKTAGRAYFQPVGCERCEVGYRGKVLVAEAMPVRGAVRDTFLEGTDEDSLRQVALEEGMVPLREAALEVAGVGETSLEEALMVTDE